MVQLFYIMVHYVYIVNIKFLFLNKALRPTRDPAVSNKAGQRKCADNKSGKNLLIRDRDTKFSREFDELFKNMGFTIQKTPFMSPNMNSYAES